MFRLSMRAPGCRTERLWKAFTSRTRERPPSHKFSTPRFCNPCLSPALRLVENEIANLIGSHGFAISFAYGLRICGRFGLIFRVGNRGTKKKGRCHQVVPSS